MTLIKNLEFFIKLLVELKKAFGFNKNQRTDLIIYYKKYSIYSILTSRSDIAQIYHYNDMFAMKGLNNFINFHL